MMIEEFIERTGYKPSMEEYRIIEESYYDSETISKDEFCKQWKKDQKSGKWAMELKFRMMLKAQKTEYEAKIKEQEETLQFYREQFEIKRDLEQKVKAQNELLEKLRRRTDRLNAVWDE